MESNDNPGVKQVINKNQEAKSNTCKYVGIFKVTFLDFILLFQKQIADLLTDKYWNNQ